MIKNKKIQKVIVGMSGGVDSSVSAMIIKQQGYHVTGLFMKNWEEDDNNTYCSSSKDLKDAQSVCDQLGIVLRTVNFSFEYWNNVFKKFLKEYELGRTPNPDILCNQEIKFKVFLEFCIKELESDFIATGHYVRNHKLDGTYCLLRGLDRNKDQSYFLYTLSHKQISKCLFPIGALTKSKVRKIAKENNLITANKKDSTGICFIGKRKFQNFLANYLPSKPGIITNINGQKIGSHKGSIYYTIGQRRGLGIGGTQFSNTKPWYVASKDIIKNYLTVVQDRNHPILMSSGIIIYKLHWIDRKKIRYKIYCTVKIRYRQQDIPCYVEPKSNGYALVIFSEKISSVAPGQSAVFYIEEHCLGGGIIEKCIN